MGEFFSAVVLGFGLGALYALASQGLIVIYRGSGVLNLGQGGVGLIAAYLWWELNANHGWPYLPALIAALVVAGLLGAFIHLFIMKPLQRASPLARTVATLAVLITAQSVVLLRYASTVTTVQSSLPTNVWVFHGVALPADRLLLLAIAVAISICLWVFYRYTKFGLATAAVAERPRIASGLAISPDLVGALNWALGSALGAVAAILVSPILTLQISSMTTLVLASLAAAVVANFRSFTVALVASVVMGAAQSVCIRYVADPGISSSLPFVVIVLVMVFRGQAIPLRDHMLERLPAVGTGRIRPIALVIAVAGAVVLIAFSTPDWADAFSSTFSAGIIMLSIVVITGYTGQLSLAQYALAGFGALITGRLAGTTGTPLWLAIIIGIASTVLVGLLFALPAIRTRGINLAILTLGIGTALELTLFDSAKFTGGVEGTPVNTNLLGLNINALEHPTRYALMALICFVLVGLMVANLRRGRMGRRMVAVRTNERAAAALGIDARAIKLYAFGVSAGIAALGGILIADYNTVIDFSTFTSFTSVTYVAWTFLGGIGSVLGPLVGATFVPGTFGTQVGDLIFSNIENYAALIGGILLTVNVLLNQDGVVPQVGRQIEDVKRVARKIVPAQSRKPRKPIKERQLAVGKTSRVRPMTLAIEGLTVRYGAVLGLNDVSLSVNAGQVIGLIGPNGAGKTTLIDGITGFAHASAGQITLNGRNLSRVSAYNRARAGLSRSFQSLELFEDLTVFENLQTASDSRRLSSFVTDLIWPRESPLSGEVVAAIDMFGLRPYLNETVSSLPYGLRRLVAIARAVAPQPSVLLLDEPAAGLSETETSELGRLVRRLAEDWGIAVLVIEHDIQFVLNTSDEIVVLDFGHMISSGTPSVVRNDPAVIAAYLGTGGQAAAEAAGEGEEPAPDVQQPPSAEIGVSS